MSEQGTYPPAVVGGNCGNNWFAPDETVHISDWSVDSFKIVLYQISFPDFSEQSMTKNVKKVSFIY